MFHLDSRLQQLESYIPEFAKTSPQVSSASVGWHIEHSLLTIQRIMHAIESSDPHEYKSSFRFSKLVVLTFGIIPRGRAKSPLAVVPANNLDTATLYESLNRTRNILQQITTLKSNQYFLHPVFGQLNKKKALKFIEVHTHHHLKIMRDIMKRQK